MADLIDRHVAIDAVQGIGRLATLPDNDAVIRISAVEYVLFTLPSVQPETHEERTETHACDSISRQAAMEEISKQQTYKMFEGEDTLYLDANDVGSVLASLPSAQPEPQWIPCSECMYWRDERVLMNDGKARQYNGDEPDALGIKHSVTIDVGINEGAKCLYEEDRGWSTDHTTFRNADDFCSRAKKRPCSYEEWYGIVDGVYAEPWRGEEHG